jgi:hypothetical protein
MDKSERDEQAKDTAYESETNAAGGGARRQSSPTWDNVGTGGEGVSTDPATDDERTQPSAHEEVDKAGDQPTKPRD